MIGFQPRLFFIGIVPILFVVHQTQAQNGNVFACKNGKFLPNNATNEKLAACHKAAGDEMKDPKCAAFCFTDAINGLEDMLPSKKKFDTLIDTEFPANEKQKAKEMINFCFEQHAGKIDLNDPKCVDIAAFSACATSTVINTSC